MARALTGPLVAAALLVGALVAVDRTLERRSAEERRAQLRIGRLIPKEERERAPVAGVKLEIGKGSLVFVNEDGHWRSSHKNAVGSEERLKSLITKLHEAEGTIQSEDAARSANFGFDAARLVRVTLLGPKLETLGAFEIGNGFPDRERSFLRRAGDDKVWDVDMNPWGDLAPASATLPPLVHPFTMPYWWPPSDAGLMQTIDVARPDGTAYRLTLRQLEITPDEAREGKQPYEWRLSRGPADGDGIATTGYLGAGFTLFLSRTPYLDVIESAEAQALDFEHPRARITLHATHGDPVEFALAAKLSQGRAALRCSESGLAYQLAPEVLKILFPSAEELLPPATENPWDPYLRR